jgi:hypothetical protein
MWVNLFQDTLAALALATDPPPRRILDRKPEPTSSPLITPNMWKMIIGQSVYQMVVTLVLYFAGAAIFSYHGEHQKSQLQTAVFNTYVWMQIFNMYKYVDTTVLGLFLVLQEAMLIPIQQPPNRKIIQPHRRNPPQLALYRHHDCDDGCSNLNHVCWWPGVLDNEIDW